MPISDFFGKWNSILFKGPCFVSKERQKEHHGNSTLKAFLSQWLLGQFLLNLLKCSPLENLIQACSNEESRSCYNGI